VTGELLKSRPRAHVAESFVFSPSSTGERWIEVVPASFHSGSAEIHVWVSDGSEWAHTFFT